MTRRSAAIFNPIFAHYRAGLLRELEGSETFEFWFYADDLDDLGRIPALDLASHPRFVRTRCRSVLGRFVWQERVVATALQNVHEVLIFLGNPFWISSWIGAVIARLKGRRVLFWTHGWTQRERGLKRVVRTVFYRLAHGLLLYGERGRSIAIECGLDPSRLYVIYNSLDFDLQQRLLLGITQEETRRRRAALFSDPDLPCIIGIARQSAVKRFDLLISALALMQERGEPANLILVGDGPENARLRELAAATRVNAAFVGACYDERDVAVLFTCAAVCASPGNVGLTCMHSLGYGVPVVTHDDPDDQMPEWEAIVPGVNGAVFRAGDAADLARVLTAWIGSNGASKSTGAHQELLRRKYHPAVQRKLIELAMSGLPAPDAPVQSQAVCA